MMIFKSTSYEPDIASGKKAVPPPLRAGRSLFQLRAGKSGWTAQVDRSDSTVRALTIIDAAGTIRYVPTAPRC